MDKLIDPNCPICAGTGEIGGDYGLTPSHCICRYPQRGQIESASRVSDADAIAIWRLIEVLTDGEGDSVNVLCPNPDFNGQPNFAIECNGFWTDWQDRRFAADTQLDCFQLAVAALRAHEVRTKETSSGDD